MSVPRRSLPAARVRGFTLLELTIVVVIIATIVSLTIGYYRHVQDDTKYQQCLANITLISQAMERYKSNNQFYATDLNNILADAYGLRTLPRCPAAPALGQAGAPTVTYGVGTCVADDASIIPGEYQYKLYCVGNYHSKNTTAGFPQYNSVQNKILP